MLPRATRRPEKTKDRTRNQSTPLEGIHSDVSISSSAQDMEDQERLEVDGKVLQAQDAMGLEQATRATSDRNTSDHTIPSQRRLCNVRQPTWKEREHHAATGHVAYAESFNVHSGRQERALVLKSPKKCRFPVDCMMIDMSCQKMKNPQHTTFCKPKHTTFEQQFDAVMGLHSAGSVWMGEAKVVILSLGAIVFEHDCPVSGVLEKKGFFDEGLDRLLRGISRFGLSSSTTLTGVRVSVEISSFDISQMTTTMTASLR